MIVLVPFPQKSKYNLKIFSLNISVLPELKLKVFVYVFRIEILIKVTGFGIHTKVLNVIGEEHSCNHFAFLDI